MPMPDDTPLLRALQHHLQQHDLQAVTDPRVVERLLHDLVGGHEEVFYAAVQRAMLMASLMEDRGMEMSDEAKRHVTAGMVGVWVEGFLVGASVANDEEAIL